MSPPSPPCPPQLKVVRAPEPSTVLWEHLSVSKCERMGRRLLTTILSLVLVFGSFLLLAWASYQQKLAANSGGNSPCPAYAVSQANVTANPGAPAVCVAVSSCGGVVCVRVCVCVSTGGVFLPLPSVDWLLRAGAVRFFGVCSPAALCEVWPASKTSCLCWCSRASFPPQVCYTATAPL